MGIIERLKFLLDFRGGYRLILKSNGFLQGPDTSKNDSVYAFLVILPLSAA